MSEDIDHKGLSKEKRKALEKTSGTTIGRGINCDDLIEVVPNYIAAPCEKVIAGRNNTWLVFGRDRPADLTSGYAAKGDTQAGMIDICVGRMGYDAIEENQNGAKVLCNNDMMKDAARIYISQKCDIDSYFKIARGSGEDTVGKSAIAIKADAIRIISREGMKLVTSTDPKNSKGGWTTSAGGIDLIAGNNSETLEPMVKGDSLTAYLQRLVKRISEFNGTLINYINYQLSFNIAVMKHGHISPAYGIKIPHDVVSLAHEGTPPVLKMCTKTMTSMVNNKRMLNKEANDALKQGGKKYINSRNNSTN